MTVTADAKVKGKAVAAAAGDYSQGLFSPYEPRCHFVDRAVAADGDNHIGIGVCSQLPCVPRMSGV